MRRKKSLIILIILFTGFFLFQCWKSQIKVVTEDKINLDISKQVNAVLKENYNTEIKEIDFKIIKFEDIGSIRFILYSFYNPAVGYRHCGYAEYEILGNDLFKRTDFGWNSATWNIKKITTVESGKSKKYLIVYGMNIQNGKQIYKYKHGDKEQIVEYSGDYFLNKYYIDGGEITFTIV